jgi:ABC-type antimicrobial peptide transport system ATPase subunit
MQTDRAVESICAKLEEDLKLWFIGINGNGNSAFKAFV